MCPRAAFAQKKGDCAHRVGMWDWGVGCGGDYGMSGGCLVARLLTSESPKSTVSSTLMTISRASSFRLSATASSRSRQMQSTSSLAAFST